MASSGPAATWSLFVRLPLQELHADLALRVAHHPAAAAQHQDELVRQLRLHSDGQARTVVGNVRDHAGARWLPVAELERGQVLDLVTLAPALLLARQHVAENRHRSGPVDKASACTLPAEAGPSMYTNFLSFRFRG